MSDFYFDAMTAYLVYNELSVPLSKFAVVPRGDMDIIYSINFEIFQLFNLTRSNKPRRKLSYDQVCELLLIPVEAHSHWFESLSPSDS